VASDELALPEHLPKGSEGTSPLQIVMFFAFGKNQDSPPIR